MIGPGHAKGKPAEELTLVPARVDLRAVEVRVAKSRAFSRLFGGEPDPVRIGRFVVLDRLGSGGMGVVYGAYDPDLDRRVALKLLRTDTGFSSPHASHATAPEGSKHGALLDELTTEARAAAQLSHPNVVTIFDVGQVDGRVYLAMEYVDPPTLRAWLTDDRSVEDIAAVMLQAGEGLHAAHKAGLVHRDFKPENVMVPPDAPVRVMDFGLARRLERSAAGGSPAAVLTTRAGTPAYMAPEQRTGRSVDARTDQWAFAATLYEALYRRLPKPGEPVEFPAARARELDPVPERIQVAVRRGLSTDPGDRYTELSELLEALRPPSPSSRRAYIFAGAALLAGAAVTLGVVQLAEPSQEDDQCAIDPGQIRDTWGESWHDAVEARFAEGGSGFEAETGVRVADDLDAYADGWLVARQGACRAQRAGLSTAADRMACLDRRLDSLQATREALLDPDASLAALAPRAMSLVVRLPPAQQCEQAQRLPGRAANPQDLRAFDRQVEDIEIALAARRLDEVESLLAQAPTALPPAIASSEEATATLAVLRGDLHRLRAEGDEAMEAYGAAIETGAPARLSSLVAAAAVGQTRVEAAVRSQPERALELARVADLAVAVAGAPPLLEGELGLARARASYISSEFDAGTQAAQQATEAFERAGTAGQLRLGEGLQMLAITTFGAGEHALARRFASQALAAQRPLLGEHHPALGKTASVLGAVALRTQRPDEAAAYFRRATEIYRRSLGPEHPDYGQALVNLGNAHLESGEPGLAKAEYSRALEVLEPTLEPADPRLLATRANLAGALRSLGELEDARAISLEALEPTEGAGPALAAIRCIALANLARVHDDLGDDEMAEARYGEALETRARVFGDDHPETLTLRDDLGVFYLERGRLVPAQALIDAAYEQRLARFGPGHPDVAMSLTSRARLDLARGKTESAIEGLREAASIGRTVGRSSKRGRIALYLAQALTQRGSEADLREARRLIASARMQLQQTEFALELETWCQAQKNGC